MKYLFSLLLLIFLSFACRHAAPQSPAPEVEQETLITLDPQILATQAENWKVLSEYVAMNIPLAPVIAVKKQTEALEHLNLNGRGEAHITIISKEEMEVLRTRLKLEKINQFMEQANVQSIPIQVQCLGRGQLKQGSRQLANYFLVVKSDGVLALRQKLRQLFIEAGGAEEAFRVKPFYPHITVGFTDRDLNFADGVVKDGKSCLYGLQGIPSPSIQ